MGDTFAEMAAAFATTVDDALAIYTGCNLLGIGLRSSLTTNSMRHYVASEGLRLF